MEFDVELLIHQNSKFNADLDHILGSDKLNEFIEELTSDERTLFAHFLGVVANPPVVDIKYTGLIEKDFSENFIANLLDETKYETMEETYKAIDHDLEHANKGEGANHTAQKKGICSFKCISSHLKEKLGANYKDFKLFNSFHMAKLEAVSQAFQKSKAGVVVKLTEDITLDDFILEAHRLVNHRLEKYTKV